MPIEITMPKLTDTMTEATLAKWLKKEGDAVKPGDMIAEVETDKATQELEAFEAGTVAKIVIPEGGKTPVGALIVVLAKPGEDARAIAANVKAPAQKPAAQPTAQPATPHNSAPPPTGAPQPQAPAFQPPPPMPTPIMPPVEVEDHQEGQEPEVLNTGKIRVSPLAQRMASEMGVDLATVRGSGPEGRIVKRDILEASKRTATPRTPLGTVRSAGPSTAGQAAPVHKIMKLEQKTVPLSNMRQTIARRLVQSKQYIPHFYVSIDVLMDRLIELRQQYNDLLAPQKISVTDFIARAVAIALTRVPAVNASFAETAIIQHGTVDLGIAVALDDGLVVPVVRQAHTKTVRQISDEIKSLADLGRTRKLKAEQMTGSTFTISNLGMFGVKDFNAIINPPESAILAVGGTSWQPVVKEVGGKKEIAPAQVMTLTLSADHRVVDGATGAKFLQEVKAILEAPLTMLV
ncbi:MAG TPA: pyruvate dehydrogenase complex dihydrolipoamide acetyltransferase [Phycisphaerae bacterium]|nr:pyruvate dehydrogenase complex dihydrolipoamide acetyltransferase [Phycisphaerae bacterium]